MDDLIRRDGAMDAVRDYPDDLISQLTAIEDLPSAQPDADFVTVVRCKDCKHNQCKSTSGNALCELFYGMTDQMGYCHMAERRTDE